MSISNVAKLVQAKLYRFQHKEDDARTLFDEVLAYTRSAKDDRPGRQDAYKEMGDKAREGISMAPRKLAVDPYASWLSPTSSSTP